MPAVTPLSPSVATSLHVLMEGLIDYAGLFPPSRLPLDAALPNFARYQTQATSWMLGRFILPVRDLDAVQTQADRLPDEGPPFRFSILGTGGDTTDAFIQAFAQDLNAIRRFNTDHTGRAQADLYEVRLPASVVDQPATSEDLLNRLADTAQQASVTPMSVFLEVPVRAHPDLLDVLAEVRQANASDGLTLGIKMRCGGLDASAFPSVPQVAALMHGCLQRLIPFKATAGLHHPIRHHDDDLDVMRHGFFNLFVAAVLGVAHSLDTETLERILDDQHADHFVFDDEGLSWIDLRAEVDAIRVVRQTLAHSYGSCSFDEPREDLTALGLLTD